MDDHQPLAHKFEKTKHCSLKLTNDLSKFYFFYAHFYIIMFEESDVGVVLTLEQINTLNMFNT